MNLIIATRNQHKLKEIRELFCISGLVIRSALDYPEIPDVEEDGDTFEANAKKKAVTICRETDCASLADDSGLLVDALNGAPGVYSARYAGEHADAQKNNAKLLDALSGIDRRTARFNCVIALALPDGLVQTVSGSCEGRITTELRGDHGFGYDPLFIPEGYDQTFGELDSSIKSQLSHRARALQKACQAWSNLLC